MQESILFSVITVNYNNQVGLLKTMESVLCQGYKNFEWIVIDAASTDNSLALINSIDDNRVSFISEADRGLYDGMNKGINRSKGEFLIFMNSGDRFSDCNILQSIANSIKLQGSDIVYGDAAEVWGGDRMIKRSMPHWLVAYSMFTHHQAILYRKAYVKETRYDLSFKRVADWAFTAKLLKRGARAAHLSLIICDFERGGISQQPERIHDAKAEMYRLHRNVLKINPILSGFFVRSKFLINDLRARWPKLYDFLRSKY